jgi:hypothetical protein
VIALLASAAAGLTHLAVASARSTLTALSAPPTTQASGTTGQGPEWGEAAPVGLLIILLMGAALFLLIKSMNRNLRKVPASFEPSVPVDRVGPADPATAEGSAGAATPRHESSSEPDDESDAAPPAKPFPAEPDAGDDGSGDGSGGGSGEADIAAADPPSSSLSAPVADPDGTATIQRRGSPRS